MTKHCRLQRADRGRSALGTLALGVVVFGLAVSAVGSLPQEALGDSFQSRRTLDPWNVDLNRKATGKGQDRGPRVRPTAKRHIEYLQAGVPLEYRSGRSPYANAGKVITEGGRLYRANCVACHGEKGRGDGDAGMDLLPSPALLSQLMDEQGSVDEYLMWSIAEGGEPFGTSMPAYKDRLLENDIWRIVGYMRAGFPPVAEE